MRRTAALLAACAILSSAGPRSAAAQPADVPRTIERVRSSVVAVGTYERTRTPPFRFLGTGFAVGDGNTLATNAHVLAVEVNAERRETFAVVVPAGAGQAQLRAASRGAADRDHDLALLRIEGPPLPPLVLGDSETVREGESILFTGFPIGNVLGPFPATHRGMVSAITPIAIPPATSGQLNPQLIRQLGARPFPVFQLDATAYPGNSGSPLYSADTGAVLGIVNMVFVKGSKESALTAPSGITYAIPVRHLVALLKREGK